MSDLMQCRHLGRTSSPLTGSADEAGERRRRLVEAAVTPAQRSVDGLYHGAGAGQGKAWPTLDMALWTADMVSSRRFLQWRPRISLLLHSVHGSSVLSRLVVPGMDAVWRLERDEEGVEVEKEEATHRRTDGRGCRGSVLKARDAADVATNGGSQLPPETQNVMPHIVADQTRPRICGGVVGPYSYCDYCTREQTTIARLLILD